VCKSCPEETHHVTTELFDLALQQAKTGVLPTTITPVVPVAAETKPLILPEIQVEGVVGEAE